jgi:hypothetical protein
MKKQSQTLLSTHRIQASKQKTKNNIRAITIFSGKQLLH